MGYLTFLLEKNAALEEQMDPNEDGADLYGGETVDFIAAQEQMLEAIEQELKGTGESPVLRAVREVAEEVLQSVIANTAEVKEELRAILHRHPELISCLGHKRKTPLSEGGRLWRQHVIASREVPALIRMTDLDRDRFKLYTEWLLHDLSGLTVPVQACDMGGLVQKLPPAALRLEDLYFHIARSTTIGLHVTINSGFQGAILKHPLFPKGRAKAGVICDLA